MFNHIALNISIIILKMNVLALRLIIERIKATPTINFIEIEIQQKIIRNEIRQQSHYNYRSI